MIDAKPTNIEKIDEVQLISLFQNEDRKEEAFSKLVSIYQKQLYIYVRRLVLNHEDADDVLQNTFIKIWKGLDKFRGESKISTWMYKIAMNESFTFLRKRNSKKNVSYETVAHLIQKDLEADVYYNGDEIQRKLQSAVFLLPEKQKIVFIMKYYEDKKYKEISEITETSVGALKASYHHAVKKIEEFLKRS